jgi:hypothetical protein
MCDPLLTIFQEAFHEIIMFLASTSSSFLCIIITQSEKCLNNSGLPIINSIVT